MHTSDFGASHDLGTCPNFVCYSFVSGLVECIKLHCRMKVLPLFIGQRVSSFFLAIHYLSN